MPPAFLRFVFRELGAAATSLAWLVGAARQDHAPASFSPPLRCSRHPSPPFSAPRILVVVATPAHCLGCTATVRHLPAGNGTRFARRCPASPLHARTRLTRARGGTPGGLALWPCQPIGFAPARLAPPPPSPAGPLPPTAAHATTPPRPSPCCGSRLGEWRGPPRRRVWAWARPRASMAVDLDPSLEAQRVGDKTGRSRPARPCTVPIQTDRANHRLGLAKMLRLAVN